MKTYLSKNNLLNRFPLKKFIKHFVKDDNWHEIDLKTKNLGYGLIHYSLIRVNQPKRILCIGSKYGFIPAICALACKHNQYGKVDFVDAGFDQSDLLNKEQHWGGVGFWKTKKGKNQFNKFSLKKFITQHLTTSLEFSTKNKANKWDYIYIDGDHSYEGAKLDYQLFWPRLTKNGIMSFHDICVKEIDGVKYGVHRLWKELDQNHSQKFEFPGKYGLGMVQKKASHS
jgi:hypothetical protein